MFDVAFFVVIFEILHIKIHHDSEISKKLQKEGNCVLRIKNDYLKAKIQREAYSTDCLDVFRMK